MSPIELLAAALGVANIVLLVRRSVWNYPFGIAMVALYIVVFRDARLYAEAGLQVFFLAAQVWGWALWVRAGGAQDDGRVPVRWLDWPSRAVWLAVTAALSLNLGWVLHRFTDAALPYADSAIAGASVAAQILLALRRIENWVLWIAIDAAAIVVYISKDLLATAALYALFLAFSGLGLREWIAAARSRA
jgi:nicotinamide mononucleotide transporter